ncbi:BTAD domain-containing putative transcriptional regulator [Streptomyces sp. NPDC049040]|uniref:AfsR/SARP family transcriptional regulator n=1 Tax=Streptomyces sp. NPDC049040 TaxID=3365593 RepID=UPI00371A6300
MGVRFEVLGPLRVLKDGELLQVRAAKPRLLLTALLLEANSPVSLDRLLAVLWEDRPPKSALANIRSYVNQLRGVLGSGRLGAHAPGYRLDVRPGELDMLDFRDLVRRGRAARAEADDERAGTHFGAALALWRGGAAENVPRTLAVEARLDALEEQRCLAVEEWARAELALGRHGEVIGALRDTLAARPTRERLWRQLMLALYATGDVAGALTAYGQARQALDGHLGVEPGAELNELHRLMLNRDPHLEALEPAPLPAASCPRCPRPRCPCGA